MAISIYNATRAICLCFLLIPTFSWYLPDVESKLRYFHEHQVYVADVWPNAYGSIFFLILAMPFLAARVSPVAAIASALPVLGKFWIFRDAMVRGTGGPVASLQHDIARRLVSQHRK